MESNAEKELKFTSIMEKVVLYFLYVLFGGLFIFLAWFESLKEALPLIPVMLITIPLTKWGMKWQNERYIRSAKNQDDLEEVLSKLQELENRITRLENI
ncbi:MAG: hypothetical protein O3C71_05790 [Actinomycetota bacterium]|nr:hypothetical protein [Actinomycetota bacterium]